MESGDSFLRGMDTFAPPMFDGRFYEEWKKRMEIYIQSVDFGLWRVILNGLITPIMSIEGIERPKRVHEYDDLEMRKFSKNIEAMKLIQSALDEKSYELVRHLKSAQDIWRMLEAIYGDAQRQKDDIPQPKCSTSTIHENEEPKCLILNTNEVKLDSLDDELNELHISNNVANDIIDNNEHDEFPISEMHNLINDLRAQLCASMSRNKSLEIQLKEALCAKESIARDYTSLNERYDSLKCEHDILNAKYENLSVTCERLTMGKENLDALLGSQKHASDKHGVGFDSNVDIASSSKCDVKNMSESAKCVQRDSYVKDSCSKLTHKKNESHKPCTTRSDMHAFYGQYMQNVPYASHDRYVSRRSYCSSRYYEKSLSYTRRFSYKDKLNVPYPRNGSYAKYFPFKCVSHGLKYRFASRNRYAPYDRHTYFDRYGTYDSIPNRRYTCTYCMKVGHISSKCNVRRIVEQGNLVPRWRRPCWVVKSQTTNLHGPNKTWVPKPSI